jgi:hypothetical protein
MIKSKASNQCTEKSGDILMQESVSDRGDALSASKNGSGIGSGQHRPSQWDLDSKVGMLMLDLYFDAKCGLGAAEYNLEKAGMIRMIQQHVAGESRDGDNGWTDLRWTLTERGRRASVADLSDIMLRDPPLKIALSDADLEAADVANNCGNCPPGDKYLRIHKRILAHLKMRIQRIRSTH